MAVTKQKVELLLSFAKTLHERIILATGGVQGVRDEGGLYHSLAKVISRADRIMDPFDICAY